jgi:hypothetical protein
MTSSCWTPNPSGVDLADARAVAGIPATRAAQLVGITLRSWRRLERAARVRPIYVRLVAWIAGSPPDPAWDGWRFAHGLLWSPEGSCWSPGDLRAQPYERAALRELRIREYAQEIIRAPVVQSPEEAREP